MPWKGLKLLRFDNTINEFGHIFTAPAQKWLFRSYSQKSDPSIRSGDHDLLEDRYILTTEWFLRDIFEVLCRVTLWPWPFDLDIVSYTVPLMSDPHTNFDYPTVIGYRVMNYWIWSHFHYWELSLRMRRVTWPVTRRQNGPHVWNPWPKFTYSLSLSLRYDED